MDEPEDKKTMAKLIFQMRIQMGRWPTDEEVYDFIQGDEQRKLEILNG